jgi:hypothetical protein
VILPSLAKCRAAFAKVMNGEIQWQTDFDEADFAEEDAIVP